MPKPVANIMDAVRPLCIYNSILGLSVFEVPSGHPWLKLSILYVILRSVVYAYLFWSYADLQSSYKIFKTLLTTIRIILYGNIFIAIVSTIVGLKNYKKLKRFARKITLADETLEIFGIEPDYEATQKEIMRAIIIWLTVSFIILINDLAIAFYFFHDYYNVCVRVLVFEFPLILNLTIELNFSVLLSILGKRFERLNALIQSVASTPQQTVNLRDSNKYQNILKRNANKITVQSAQYNNNRNNIELVLRTARQLHLDLCATSRELNDTFSKQLSMQMAATFLLLTGFGYCTYIVYNEANSSIATKVQYFSSFGVWIVTSVLKIIHVVRVSVNVSNESQKTSQIAHEIQVSRWQKKIIDEIHQLSLQIMQHPLYFTASGLIVLDFGYVRGFVGSVTTYLMILIQNQPDMIKAANTLAEISAENETISKYP